MASQLTIYKCGRGFDLRVIVKQIQTVVKAGLEHGQLDCESDVLTTRPLDAKNQAIRYLGGGERRFQSILLAE